MGRFDEENLISNGTQENVYYKIPRPGLLWNDEMEAPLPEDGGRKRPKRKQKTQPLLETVKSDMYQGNEQTVVQYKLLESTDLDYNE